MKTSQLPATVFVGKTGVTDAVVQELRGQLARRHVVKVRFPPPSPPSARLEMCRDLARRVACGLVEVRGNTAVFADGHGLRRPKTPTPE